MYGHSTSNMQMGISAWSASLHPRLAFPSIDPLPVPGIWTQCCRHKAPGTARALSPDRLIRVSAVGQSTSTSDHFLFSLPFIISSILLWALRKEEELKTESRTFSGPVLLSQLETQQRTLALGLCRLPAAHSCRQRRFIVGCVQYL